MSADSPYCAEIVFAPGTAAPRPVSAERGAAKIGYHRNRSRGKVTWIQVVDIRKWARSDGFGLSVPDQVRSLRADPRYAELGTTTVKDILTNATWYDPDYTPLEKMDVDEHNAVTGLMLWVIVWLWLSRFRGVVQTAPSALPGIAYEHQT